MRARAFVVMLLAATAGLRAGSVKTAVIGSQHDLTVTGSGPVKSGVSSACIICHAPHNINPNVTPLWNHALSSQSYVTYNSTTYKGGAETPSSGSSKLCLSCHDGTVAVGLTVAQGTVGTSGSMTAADVLGTNLQASHPVSMSPADDGEIVTSLIATPPTSKDPAVVLVNGKVECTTCHDPHKPNNDTKVQMFLTRSNASGGMCLACHDPTRVQPNPLYGYTVSAHGTSSNTTPVAAGFGSYGTVATNGCSNCHLGHNNAAGARNVRALEEAACTPCHGGTNLSPVLRNITGEYAKTYVHPTMTVSGAHDAAEAVPVNTARHAECADCHNSHTATAQVGTALPPALQSDLAGVNGYDTSGPQTVAITEYQVCFKCHADSSNKPATSIYGRTAVRYPGGPMPTGYPLQPPRPADQYNLRLKFMSAISHNVMGSSVPTTSNTTLRPFMLNVDGVTNNTTRPLTSTSRIYCTDCHNNDQARNSNGTGPNGPHGSAFPHLLQSSLFQDAVGGGGGGGGTAAAGICNKCHNLNSVRNISPHDDHNTVGCTTCHDPHGVIGGSPGANRALINFDTSIAARATTSNYFGYFYISANNKGCYTSCHGENHNPRIY